jgi:UDP-N-acetylglucosamine--N-acetylmuramyl-(pentapeptide) pyrophosphoryl-undecaprenol N-acetylglucosamine transferase
VEVYTLPAVGLQNRNYLPFLASFGKSVFAAWKIFYRRRPDAVLAMGGFTSAPPVFAGKDLGAKAFLHESNTIPGRSNRFLSRFVDVAFVGFPEAAARLKSKTTRVTGTPVRSEFASESRNPDSESRCRQALGLNPDLPTVLVVGGSQGARGLNDLILSALPLLKGRGWQWLHLTGVSDLERVKAAYAAQGMDAVVRPFLAEMDLALGAATACVSRAGASSLAEIAAMRLPSALVPLPTSADNHQFFNASAYEATGAARLLDQKNSPPEKVVAVISELMENVSARSQIQAALARWHAPAAAGMIAENILSVLAGNCSRNENPSPAGSVKLKTVA